VRCRPRNQSHFPEPKTQLPWSVFNLRNGKFGRWIAQNENLRRVHQFRKERKVSTAQQILLSFQQWLIVASFRIFHDFFHVYHCACFLDVECAMSLD
jgi:endonuclease/exonuclease/phosphatase (EEP) superfamily protein YafD